MIHQTDRQKRAEPSLISVALPVAFVLFCMCYTAALGQTPPPAAGARAPEIEAECWFNVQPTRLYESPELVLLEFWSVRSAASREMAKDINALHGAYDDARLLIVGLTPDACKDAERFVRQHELMFRIGAASESLKTYRIDELPAILLVDPAKHEILERWSGRDIKLKSVALAIQQRLGPPKGASQAGRQGNLTPDEHAVLMEGFAGADASLAAVTERVLAREGTVGVESLAPLDEFYRASLPKDASSEDFKTRTLNHARMMLTADGAAGYGKLLSSGRLSDEARSAVRDRVLDIAQNDPDPSVQIMTIQAIRKSLGQPGDPALLEALRNMRASMGDVSKGKGNPLVRASLDDAIEELDAATRDAKLEKRQRRPMGLDLHRMLNKEPNPASSPWADAYAYKKSVPDKSTEQLFEDYWANADPADDEVGRQNATLTRDAALDEVENRLMNDQIRDLDQVRDQLQRALSQEPDEWVRRYAVDGLMLIAENGGRSLRNQVIEIFEKRLQEEPDRYVRARLQLRLEKLKG